MHRRARGPRFISEPFNIAHGEYGSVNLKDPAPGADYVYTVTGDAMVRVHAFRGRLTTSAVVANRRPQVQVADSNGRVIWVFNSGSALLASSLQDFVWNDDWVISNGSASGYQLGQLPRYLLMPGWTVSMATTSIDVGDQWTLGNVVRSKFFTGEYGYAEGAEDDHKHAEFRAHMRRWLLDIQEA